jgi:type II secretory pathway component PulC
MYKLNESLGDYVVSEILKDRVILLWNGEKVEVKLREDKGVRPTPVAQVQRTQQLQRQQQKRTSRIRPRRPRRIRRNVPPPPPQAQQK